MTHVLVLMGGTSAEREVSLVSGKACVEALSQAGYRVSALDVDGDIRHLVHQLSPAEGRPPDVVFNALHGSPGEDGSIQGLLDMLGLAYTHSGVMASAIAMDKAMARRVFQSIGLRCAEGRVCSIDELRRGDPMPRPYVVKPVRQGSSVGVHIVRAGGNEGPLDLSDWSFGDEALVERFIEGKELTVAVMGDRALAVTELRPVSGFYDYVAKYTDGHTQHIVPAQIPEPVAARAKEMALKAHQVLGCTGVTRADLRYDDRTNSPDGVYLLEINTQPGMTPLSLVPEQARYLGMDFPALVKWIVEDALCRR
jgi:D-alanine-D-alanine ligase